MIAARLPKLDFPKPSPRRPRLALVRAPAPIAVEAMTREQLVELLQRAFPVPASATRAELLSICRQALALSERPQPPLRGLLKPFPPLPPKKLFPAKATRAEIARVVERALGRPPTQAELERALALRRGVR